MIRVWPTHPHRWNTRGRINTHTHTPIMNVHSWPDYILHWSWLRRCSTTERQCARKAPLHNNLDTNLEYHLIEMYLFSTFHSLIPVSDYWNHSIQGQVIERTQKPLDFFCFAFCNNSLKVITKYETQTLTMQPWERFHSKIKTIQLLKWGALWARAVLWLCENPKSQRQPTVSYFAVYRDLVLLQNTRSARVLIDWANRSSRAPCYITSAKKLQHTHTHTVVRWANTAQWSSENWHETEQQQNSQESWYT